MGHAPENTIASFQKALDLGCDEVETDVWLVDDRFVISHDRPGTGASGGDTPLSLDEVLDFCRGRMGVNVELKCAADEAQAVATGERVARHLAARADHGRLDLDLLVAGARRGAGGGTGGPASVPVH